MTRRLDGGYAMTTLTHTIGIAALIALSSGALTSGCSSSRAAATPQQEPAAVAASGVTETKTTAPVRVALTASGQVGTVVLTLDVLPQADIPRGIARIVLPKELKLVSGQAQAELGPLKRGVAVQHQVTVEVPSGGPFQVFAGVDCHITSGVHLHKPAEALVLGQAAPTP